MYDYTYEEFMRLSEHDLTQATFLTIVLNATGYLNKTQKPIIIRETITRRIEDRKTPELIKNVIEEIMFVMRTRVKKRHSFWLPVETSDFIFRLV